MSEMLNEWKKVSDAFLAQWGQAFSQAAANPQSEEAAQEVQRTYLGMRTAMAEAARNAYGPVIEAVGAVPLSEFQRLADQVQTILLRMDRIDDRLRALAAQPQQPPKAVRAKTKAKKKGV